MVIIQIMGGLGNQLQQYALYRKLKSMGKEARVDLSWFAGESQDKVSAGREIELLYLDGVELQECTRSEKRKLIGAEGISGRLRRKLFPSGIHLFRESGLYHPELFTFEDMYISGYFACEKYYRDILPLLREEIGFPESQNEKNRYWAERMRGENSVSVHLRRGDYLESENDALFGGICTEKYYRSAMELIEKETEKPLFYFFSDDPDYVREHYLWDGTDQNRTLIDINHGRDSFYDMYLMSCCRHNICANSTFSFWGARLNHHPDKIMIRPTIHKNTQSFCLEEMKELWRGWRFISPEGTENGE